MSGRTAWAVKVYGAPAPKGSMKCVGGRGRHQLINNNPATKPWEERVAAAARLLGVDVPIEGPCGVSVAFTVDRPKSIKPAARPWPHKTGSTSDGGGGDVDKLARTVLDALQVAEVIKNDSQVVQLSATKVYPDSPGAVDALERSGVFIRLYLI